MLIFMAFYPSNIVREENSLLCYYRKFFFISNTYSMAKSSNPFLYYWISLEMFPYFFPKSTSERHMIVHYSLSGRFLSGEINMIHHNKNCANTIQ